MTVVNVNVGRTKTFRGKNFEELKNLDIREFAMLLKSREKRTLLRNFAMVERFVEKSKKDVAKNKIPKTHSREIPIVPAMVGWIVGVHNGKEYTQVKITEEMLGYRLGEFAMTRRIVKHSSAGIGSTKGSKSAKK